MINLGVKSVKKSVINTKYNPSVESLRLGNSQLQYLRN